MKKIATIFAAIVLSAASGLAQKNTPTRAYNLYAESNYEAAKECIDQCILDEKYNTKANTWLYKANIDHMLASMEYSAKQNDDKYVNKHPNTPVEAFDAYKKALSINKNVEGFEMKSPGDGLPIIYPLLFIQGVNELVANQFEAARNTLAKAVESYEMQTPPQYPLEGKLYYYYAYALEMNKDMANAEKYYQKALADGSKDMNVFIRLIESYKKTDRKADVLSLIEQAKRNDASNVNILVAEAEYYFWTGDNERGRQLLKNLPATINDSPDALINAANLYIKDNQYGEAEKLLKRAYANNPSAIIAHNLGVCCSNIGEDKYMEANKLDVNGKKSEGEMVKREADQYMLDAAEYFEKASKEEINDISVLYKLKEIYLRLGKESKVQETEKRIQSIENK